MRLSWASVTTKAVVCLTQVQSAERGKGTLPSPQECGWHSQALAGNMVRGRSVQREEPGFDAASAETYCYPEPVS